MQNFTGIASMSRKLQNMGRIDLIRHFTPTTHSDYVRSLSAIYPDDCSKFKVYSIKRLKAIWLNSKGV